jgi:hypothetical protein
MPTLWEIAKEKLTEEIIAGRIKDDWKPSYVRTLDPKYEAVDAVNFSSNLRQLRERLKKFKTYADTDDEALQMDRLLHPINYEGRWAGSEAEKLLKIDLEQRKNLHMKPSELRDTRTQYKCFSKDQFRKHIDQEIRSARDSLYWLVLRDENKKKKGDKQAKKEAKRLQIISDPLLGLTVRELKEKLRQYNLKLGGTKQELLQRIKDHENKSTPN